MGRDLRALWKSWSKRLCTHPRWKEEKQTLRFSDGSVMHDAPVQVCRGCGKREASKFQITSERIRRLEAKDE